MPNLLLISPTNNGKSKIIEKFLKIHPRTSESDQDFIPVLSVQMPSEPSILRFHNAILSSLGSPLRFRIPLAVAEQQVITLLRQVGIKILVIDELHNILSGNSNSRREFLNLLRYLGNELRIPLVGVGTYEAYLAIRSDDQLENRFEPFILPLWKPNEETLALLASFATSFPLRKHSNLATSSMANYLLNRCEGTIGELAALLTKAAIAAIESSEEVINQRILTMADYQGPTERRRKLERELI